MPRDVLPNAAGAPSWIRRHTVGLARGWADSQHGFQRALADLTEFGTQEEEVWELRLVVDYATRPAFVPGCDHFGRPRSDLWLETALGVAETPLGDVVAAADHPVACSG